MKINKAECLRQVGLGSPDHGYWGPPEVMTMERPSMKIDAADPGECARVDYIAAIQEHLCKVGFI